MATQVEHERQRLPQAGFRLTYCPNVTLGRRDFYRHMCHALGSGAGSSRIPDGFSLEPRDVVPVHASNALLANDAARN